MPNVGEILQVLAEFAPLDLAIEKDNIGLLIGRPSAEVTRVLCALDVTDATIDEAKAIGAQLIVTHHPSLFRLNTVTDSDPMDARVLRLAEEKIAHIAMHTNADITDGGVNDCLAATLGLHNVGVIPNTEGCCRIGTVDECDLRGFAHSVRDKLHANGVRYVDAGHRVHRVAVGGGACAEFINAVKHCGADTFVVGDAKYHDFLRARHAGLNLIDAGHFPTEDVIIPVFVELICKAFPLIEVTKSNAMTDDLHWI